MPYVDLELIKSRLFDNATIAQRICRDYGLDDTLRGDALASAFIKTLDQDPSEPSVMRPQRAREPHEVFRAAVRALGSNNRTWASFMRFEETVRRLTDHYDPAYTAHAEQTGKFTLGELAACLPGQTGEADARAVLKWANLLANQGDYYESLRQLADHLEAAGMQSHEAVMATAVALGATSASVEDICSPPHGLETWKAPGMGPPLASEFLRNLQWQGFKADRHVKRFFDRCFQDVFPAPRERASSLANVLGSKSREVLEPLEYSLVGVAVTPPGASYTLVDNLVWALGAYVEKKGKESNLCYRIE